jgi:hypothetical protein
MPKHIKVENPQTIWEDMYHSFRPSEKSSKGLTDIYFQTYVKTSPLSENKLKLRSIVFKKIFYQFPKRKKRVRKKKIKPHFNYSCPMFNWFGLFFLQCTVIILKMVCELGEGELLHLVSCCDIQMHLKVVAYFYLPF